ncbi:hypothetical protein BVH06_04620 [Pseudomonas sp. PA27(2017)]|nr:hypothetical protein BVH06_04620 [Pseudomonas sp. PA27(2017)]
MVECFLSFQGIIQALAEVASQATGQTCSGFADALIVAVPFAVVLLAQGILGKLFEGIAQVAQGFADAIEQAVGLVDLLAKLFLVAVAGFARTGIAVAITRAVTITAVARVIGVGWIGGVIRVSRISRRADFTRGGIALFGWVFYAGSARPCMTRAADRRRIGRVWRVSWIGRRSGVGWLTRIFWRCTEAGRSVAALANLSVVGSKARASGYALIISTALTRPGSTAALLADVLTREAIATVRDDGEETEALTC